MIPRIDKDITTKLQTDILDTKVLNNMLANQIQDKQIRQHTMTKGHLKPGMQGLFSIQIAIKVIFY